MRGLADHDSPAYRGDHTRETRSHNFRYEIAVTVTVQLAGMALTNAERQRRFRERRRAAVPVKQRPEHPAARPKPRPARWTAAVAELRQLQAEYEAWRDGLPEGLADSKTGQLLEGVCEVDLDAIDVELPRGFGRD